MVFLSNIKDKIKVEVQRVCRQLVFRAAMNCGARDGDFSMILMQLIHRMTRSHPMNGLYS